MANIFEKINTLTLGQQASLRRSAGKSLDEVDAGALQAFFSSVAPQKPYDQEKAFTVACIACLWKQEERSNAVSFAKCLQRLRSTKDGSTEGIDSRLRSLIDTPWNDDDGYLAAKLVRLARMLKSNDIGYPDPEELFRDLKNWDHPDRFVQRRWMEQYLFANQNDTENNEQEE